MGAGVALCMSADHGRAHTCSTATASAGLVWSGLARPTAGREHAASGRALTFDGVQHYTTYHAVGGPNGKQTLVCWLRETTFRDTDSLAPGCNKWVGRGDPLFSFFPSFLSSGLELFIAALALRPHIRNSTWRLFLSQCHSRLQHAHTARYQQASKQAFSGAPMASIPPRVPVGSRPSPSPSTPSTARSHDGFSGRLGLALARVIALVSQDGVLD